jgi:hypothetical protein
MGCEGGFAARRGQLRRAVPTLGSFEGRLRAALEFHPALHREKRQAVGVQAQVAAEAGAGAAAPPAADAAAVSLAQSPPYK